MALELDTRQRAMLKEMGVHVWQPGTAFAPPSPPAQAAQAAQTARAVSAPLPVPTPPAPLSAATSPPVPRSPAVQSAQPAQPAQPLAAGLPAAAHGLGWPELADAVAHCTACGLCSARKHTTLQVLPGALRTGCDWLVLGDPPDADEDRTGSPFAGADGVLLGNMLAAVGVQRVNFAESPEVDALAALPASARAYVSNVVKCRPAHGQIPQPGELAQCAGYLQREIALVRPKIILALGRFAQQLVLGEDPALAQQPLGKLRGTVHRYQGVDVVLSYHPKALMRHSADKGKAWADLCLAADTLAAAR